MNQYLVTLTRTNDNHKFETVFHCTKEQINLFISNWVREVYNNYELSINDNIVIDGDNRQQGTTTVVEMSETEIAR